MKKTVLSALALGAGLTLALAVPLSASAHVTASATSTAAGSYTVVTFSVPHGCDGQATNVITIDIPEDIISVTPTRNPNWTISEVTAPLEPPVEDATERDAQVVYTAVTPLPADQRDVFELSLKLPEGEAGDVVEFPVTQDCVDGGQTVWTGDEVPSITLTAAVEGDEHGHDHGTATEEHTEEATHNEAAATGGDDVLARVLGISGLVVGAAGIVIAIVSRRKQTQQ